ncbi:MAG: hypothetical protein ABSG35_11905 [Syntrophobacteraceae bacterium]|jgi:hypothetical protein
MKLHDLPEAAEQILKKDYTHARAQWMVFWDQALRTEENKNSDL